MVPVQWYANFIPAPSHTSLEAFTQSPVALGAGAGREFQCCPSQRKMVVSPTSHTSVEPLPRTIVSPSVVGTATRDQVPGRPTLSTTAPLLHAPNVSGKSARIEPREAARNVVEPPQQGW